MTWRIGLLAVIFTATVSVFGVAQEGQPQTPGRSDRVAASSTETALPGSATESSSALSLRIRIENASINQGDSIRVYVEVYNTGSTPVLIHRRGITVHMYPTGMPGQIAGPFLVGMNDEPYREPSDRDWIPLYAGQYFGLTFTQEVYFAQDMLYVATYDRKENYEAFGIAAWIKELNAECEVAVKLSEEAKVRFATRLHEATSASDVRNTLWELGTSADAAFLPILVEIAQKEIRDLGLTDDAASDDIDKRAYERQQLLIRETARHVECIRRTIPGASRRPRSDQTYDVGTRESIFWAKQYLADHPEVVEQCRGRLERGRKTAGTPKQEAPPGEGAATVDTAGFTITIR